MRRLALTAVLLLACDRPPPQAHTTLERLGEGVVVADSALAAEIARRGPEAREQVRREYAAGAIADVEAGLARFDELMRPTTIARDAIRTVGASLLLAEAALDLWADGGRDFMVKAACLVGTLLELGRALADAGVDMPTEIMDAIGVLSILTTAACPAAEPAEAP